MKPPPGFVYHHSDGQMAPEPEVFHTFVNPSTGQKWGYWVYASTRDAMRAMWHEPRKDRTV